MTVGSNFYLLLCYFPCKIQTLGFKIRHNFENKYIEIKWKLKNYLHLSLSTISIRPKKHNHVKYRDQKCFVLFCFLLRRTQ